MLTVQPRAILPILALCCATAAPLTAQTWKLVKPSTTGIPGESVRMVRFAPNGLVWAGARWPFWTEGGFGIYDRTTDLWTTLSNADGTFPSAFPNDIAWAADDSAWIATGNGLVHLKDGVQKVYTTANAPLLHNVIASVDLDLDGHVWINNSSTGTSNAAIFEFDGVSWRQFTVGAELPWALPWRRLSDVLVDHRGHVWVANEVLNGLAEYDGVRWRLHGETVGRFGEIAEDTAGNLWLRAGVGGGNAFWKYDRASFTIYPVSTTPTAIGIDDDGAVYLGDWLGTIRKTVNGGASFTVWARGLNQVFDIAPDPASTDVWIGTIGAVGHFNGAGELLRDYNSYNTGIGDYFIDEFDVDSQGNVWVAAGESGLSRFDGRAWRNWGNHNVGSEPYPFAGNEPMGSFYLDSTGTGWMGGNGIARWDPATGQFSGFWNWQNNPALGVTMIVAFAEDAAGRLFAASEYGSIFQLEGNRWVRSPVNASAFSRFPGLESDSQGNVWAAAWFDVFRWNGHEWTKVTLPDPNYFFDLGGINAFAIGPNDVMWLGTNKGLVRWDGTTFDLFDKNNSPLPAEQVSGVDVRDDGVIGLACLEFGAVTPFPNGVAIINGDPADASAWSLWHYGTSPLPHYQLDRVIFDAEGSLWVSATSEGVAVLRNPAQKLANATPTVSATLGGTVEMQLDAGPTGAGQLYALVGTLSGTSPGVPLPQGMVLPINPDPFTALSTGIPGFVGNFDSQGRASASWDLPPVPTAIGFTFHFAWTAPGPWTVSNPVSLQLTP